MLADNDIPVAIKVRLRCDRLQVADQKTKSDHGVLNALHLVFEAQQANYFDFSWNLALSSITSATAAALGFDHRIGIIKE
jgi:hypothetical protein